MFRTSGCALSRPSPRPRETSHCTPWTCRQRGRRRGGYVSSRVNLKLEIPWTELSSTTADWDAASPKLLGTLLSNIQLIRSFEESVLKLAVEGLVHGPVHSSIGQEGG